MCSPGQRDECYDAFSAAGCAYTAASDPVPWGAPYECGDCGYSCGTEAAWGCHMGRCEAAFNIGYRGSPPGPPTLSTYLAPPLPDPLVPCLKPSVTFSYLTPSHEAASPTQPNRPFAPRPRPPIQLQPLLPTSVFIFGAAEPQRQTPSGSFVFETGGPFTFTPTQPFPEATASASRETSQAGGRLRDGEAERGRGRGREGPRERERPREGEAGRGRGHCTLPHSPPRPRLHLRGDASLVSAAAKRRVPTLAPSSRQPPLSDGTPRSRQRKRRGQRSWRRGAQMLRAAGARDGEPGVPRCRASYGEGAGRSRSGPTSIHWRAEVPAHLQ